MPKLGSVIKENKMALRMRFLPPTPRVLQNQHGAVLYGVLMVLLLLTIIGIASTKVSNTELQIAANELIYQQTFYNAEGGAMEGAERLEAIVNPGTTNEKWLGKVVEVPEIEIRPWQFKKVTPLLLPSDLLPDTSIIAIAQGVAHGSSLDLESTKVHIYAIYGRSAPPRRGATTVQIGYLKAF
jgi:hypothetical protein